MVTFADNVRSHIVGIGNISKNDSNLITNILLVEGLKYNLMNISQLCEKGYKVIFESSQ